MLFSLANFTFSVRLFFEKKTTCTIICAVNIILESQSFCKQIKNGSENFFNSKPLFKNCSFQTLEQMAQNSLKEIILQEKCTVFLLVCSNS